MIRGTASRVFAPSPICATWLCALVAATVAAAVASPADAQQDSNARRPNIVLIQTDDLHPDFLGCLGGPAETPNIDALAARGVVFRNAVAQGTSCTPSRISILTGTYPHNTGVYKNRDRRACDLPAWTFPVALRAAGYRTAHVGKNHFVPPFSDDVVERMDELGFDSTFDIAGKATVLTADHRPGRDPYQDHLREHGMLETLLADGRTRTGKYEVRPPVLPEAFHQDVFITDHAIDAIRGTADAPFFLWVNLVGPHPPADAPEPYASMYDAAAMPVPIAYPADPSSTKKRMTEASWQEFRAAYCAMITLIDAQVGRIVAALESADMLDDTVIVFTSDQGSMLGDHGESGKSTFYRSATTTPIVIAGAGVTVQGTTVERLVELLDIVPTFLDIADVASSDRQGYGKSLQPLLAGTGGYDRTMAFTEDDRGRMLLNDRYKLVVSRNETVLFDLSADPEERTNVASTNANVVETMEQAIRAYLEATPPLITPRKVEQKRKGKQDAEADTDDR